MCNTWCISFVKDSAEHWAKNARLLDVGSMNIGGSPKESVREFTSEYIGIDMRPGLDVDRVIKGEDILKNFGRESFDVVSSTEMFEHARNWTTVLYNMMAALKPDGIMVITCRAKGFGRHEYPGDYWRFEKDDFQKILEPMGTVLKLEDDPDSWRGWNGTGVIFRKNPKSPTPEEEEKWLAFLNDFPIFSMDYDRITFNDFEEKTSKDYDGRPLISLVMIVKDEAAVLEKCLESVKPIVDEYVIVDTGSTDGTQEIIKRYGELHEVPFTNFVDSKNNAMSFATGKYIMLLDADKTVIGGLEYIKEHVNDGVDCLYADVVEGNRENPSSVYLCALLWKNNGEWKFDGPGVHEVITGNAPTYIDHRIKVLHEHDPKTRDRDYYLKRFNSYIGLLQDYLSKHPNDPRGTFYLGRTLKDLQHWLDAITQFERYLALNTNFRDERWQAAYDIAECWKVQGEYDRCEEALALAEQIDPRRAETHLLHGILYYELQDFQEAVKWFEKALALPVPQDVVLFLNLKAYLELPADYLVLSYDKLKEYRRGYECAKILAENLRKPDFRISNNMMYLGKLKEKTIFFLLGVTPEPVYGGMIDKQGVGGVETTYIELPTELAKLGHKCYVFCCCDKIHSHDGVWYIPYVDLYKYTELKPDVLITSRWFDPLYVYKDAKKIAWMQDAHYADPNHEDAWQVIDAFVCSSRWHRQYTADRLGNRLDAKKINIIPLAIRGELFNQQVERDPLQVIYSSNPGRGLYVLQPMWEEITRQVPGIHLAVTYGWEGLKTWSDDPKWQESIALDEQRVMDWVAKAGNVRITGRLPKKDLYREMLASTLCVYPNDFWETFCLTAQETQAAGVPMVTSALGALNTTLGNNGNVLIHGNAHSEEYTKTFIKATVFLMKDEERRKYLSDNCLAFFKQQPDWAQVALMWEKLINSL
jgi:glycosyltransferase involved in cell wall biosynthesis/SAM-dependent methyltransferase